MPREPSGELRKLATGYEARITLKGKLRIGLALIHCTTPEAAQERKRDLAKLAARLRRAGQLEYAPRLLEAAARARDGKPWANAVEAIEIVCAGNAEEMAAGATTFAAFADEWTSGELHRKFPDHVPAKDSTRDRALLRRYIVDHIGTIPIGLVTLADADVCMSNLPAEKAPGTRRHVAQVIRRILTLAVYPGRLRKDNPIPKGWLPRVRDNKAKECLYPEEYAALLGCVDVPLIRRLAYGVLCAEGLRTDELASLTWRDVDLERGVLTLDDNKTDDPRAWNLNDGVVRTLERWRQRSQPTKPEDRIFVDGAIPLDVLRLAKRLRRDLQRAGVTRPQLFERSETRRPIRAHDLRATFVTSSLANGATETWVSDRTGHRSSQMINRYRRRARTYRGSLPALDASLPGFFVGPLPQGSPQTSQAPVVDGAEGGETTERCGSDSNRRVTDLQSQPDVAGTASLSESHKLPTARPHEVARAGAVVGPSDGRSDDALARALDAATIAGRFDVVAQLAEELKARRLAAAGVVDLKAARAKRLG